MSRIQWKEHSAKNRQDATEASSNPWFGFALLLMGIIAGYLVASFY